MDDDRRDLIRWLFVTATKTLEDAHIVAVDQGAGRGEAAYRQGAEALQRAANDLEAIARTILALTIADAPGAGSGDET